MQAPVSVSPSRMSTRRATSAAAAWSLELGLPRPIRGTAPSTIRSERRDHRFESTSAERHYCIGCGGAARQTRHGCCRSRRGLHTPRTPYAVSGFLPPTDARLGPGADHRRGTTPVDVGRQKRGTPVQSRRVMRHCFHRRCEGWGGYCGFDGGLAVGVSLAE